MSEPRDEIAEVNHEALVRIMLPASGDECSLSELRAYAVRILASDWLAERERRVAGAAWDEAVRECHDLGWMHDFARSDAIERNPYREAAQ